LNNKEFGAVFGEMGKKIGVFFVLLGKVVYFTEYHRVVTEYHRGFLNV